MRSRYLLGVAVAAITVLGLLSASAGAVASVGRLHGQVSYSSPGPLYGIDVRVLTADSYDRAYDGRTNVDGQWDAGYLASGEYVLSYNARVGDAWFQVGFEHALVAQDGSTYLETRLTGPHPSEIGRLEGTVAPPQGWPLDAGWGVTITSTDGTVVNRPVSRIQNKFSVDLPVGSYQVALTGSDWYRLLDAHLTQPSGTAVITYADTTEITLDQHAPIPIPHPSPVKSTTSDQLLGWINRQRKQWGLPGGIQEVPTWSDACAAHNHYGSVNQVLEHEETHSKARTEAGRWAGDNSVLAASGPRSFGAKANPWMDAPIHLNQLFAPNVMWMGVDSTDGYQCATTWPGMLLNRFPDQTIHTFPGDGTTGLPPSENASENPFVPGDFVGVKGIAGRELFVYRSGDFADTPIKVKSATLTSSAGPAKLKWVDQTTGNIGSHLAGAILIPVKPLLANTTYQASVTLDKVMDLGDGDHEPSELYPEQTHRWSFATGDANADGLWPSRGAALNPRHSRTLRIARRGRNVIVRGRGFTPGVVKIRRQPGNRKLKIVRVPNTGNFRVRLRWGNAALTISVSQGGKKVRAHLRARHQNMRQ